MTKKPYLFNKPIGIQITVRNRKTNETKSFTVYQTTVEEVYNTLKNVIEKQIPEEYKRIADFLAEEHLINQFVKWKKTKGY